MSPCMRVRASLVRKERGFAATLVSFLLFLAMGFIVLFASRSFIFEQRTSANQYRYTKAFEAAEGGIEWTVARINERTAINASCGSGGASSFRATYMAVNAATGVVTPNGVSPMCVIPRDGTAYQCSCPSSGVATASAVEGPAFRVEFFATDEAGAPLNAGVVRLVSHGCTSAQASCLPGGGGTPDAYARVQVLLGVIPALGSMPAATITARTTVSPQGAGSAVGVVNTDPSTNGITINAGGNITAGNARITTIPGSPPASSLIPNDTSLSSISTGNLFASYFGMSRDQFRSIATVVNCSSGCDARDITAVIDDVPSGETPLIWVDGNVAVTGNQTIGTPTQPVILVVNGSFEGRGTIDIAGLVYANSVPDIGGGGFFLRGALVSESSVVYNGTPDFYFDNFMLRTFTRVPGAFVKIPGSWKDF